jgi:serine/threonine protein kinase
LKLENVLFESKARTRIKIVDFGIAGRCKGTNIEKTDAGTLRYMAPEVLQGLDTKASPAIDFWALGVMLYCMLFYKFPFNGKEGNEIKEKIIS